jgi:Fur family transcriptional regulator, iron response regulator
LGYDAVLQPYLAKPVIRKRSQPDAGLRLKAVGLRPTRQRLALARLLFAHGPRHVTAEALHGEAQGAVRVSLATVYNTLHQFTRAGLLREVVIDPARSYFDTNTSEHHHFYDQAHCALSDIPGHTVSLAGLPQAPEGSVVERVEIIVHIRRSAP